MPKPIVLVGEAFGANEQRLGIGFVGAGGIELLRMLNEANVIELSAEDTSWIAKFWDTGDPQMVDMVWRMHPEVHRTNVFKLHPFANNIASLCGPKTEGIVGYPPLLKSKYVRREYIPHLEALGDEIAAQDPNLIVALGNTPLWALAGRTGISKIRGTTSITSHTVTGYKLLATYHPAAVLHQWELRPTTIIDLMKAKREAEFPDVRRPQREIWIDPSIEDISRFIETYIIGCERLSVDIETSGNQVTCIGLAPNPSIAIVIPFVDGRRKNRCYWSSKEHELAAWRLVSGVLSDRNIRKTFQNGLYDIAFNWRSVGVPTLGAEHDTMLLHHALQPESLKSLGFLGSIYSDEGPWKTERKGTTTIKRDE